eukprot:6727271-Ditylum_brightwellii.AAC.1
MQQVRILRCQNESNPEPPHQWAKDLLQFIKTIDPKDEILLLMDTNGPIEGDFGTFLSEAGLYDLMAAKHGTGTPATYIRGTAAVDYAGGTKGVLDAIEEIGFPNFLKYIHSNHREMYINLYLCKLFSGLLHPLQQRSACKVQLRSPAR